MIHRSQRPAKYTIVNNSLLEDEKLSLPAIGLLVYLLQKPDNFNFKPKELHKKLYKKYKSKAGYRYMLELISELERFGYIKKIKYCDGTLEYLISDAQEFL